MKGCYGFAKGIEVAGKLVDRQLQIIDDAQQKAADFLKKEVFVSSFNVQLLHLCSLN